MLQTLEAQGPSSGFSRIREVLKDSGFREAFLRMSGVPADS